MILIPLKVIKIAKVGIQTKDCRELRAQSYRRKCQSNLLYT